MTGGHSAGGPADSATVRVEGGRPLRIGLLGDRVRGYVKHEGLESSIRSAAVARRLAVEVDWVSSERLAGGVEAALAPYDGVVVTPQSSDYCAYPDALRTALGFARRRGICCLAVCGGAQYALGEWARGLTGVAAGDDILARASCDPAAGPGDYPVSGLKRVDLSGSGRVASSYGRTTSQERFACSYVVDEVAAARLRESGLATVGTTPGVGPTLFEWPEHPFYVAGLFLPHWSDGEPHPLFTGLLCCALSRHG